MYMALRHKVMFDLNVHITLGVKLNKLLQDLQPGYATLAA